VAAGLLTIVASGWLLVLAALLTSFRPENSSGEYQLVAEPAAYFLLLAGQADVLSALLAACLLGGVVAGRLSPSAPGANGATAAAFGSLAGISWLLLAVLPFSSLPAMVSFVNPVTRSVEVGTLAFWAVAPLTFYLLALLAGYLGGTLGGRLRRPSESGAG
jgi:hypothetical protein